MSLAPIIVFSYNRPNHLRQTIEALAKNDLASESDLFIFCDGAKHNATTKQSNQIIENRMVAKKAIGFRTNRIVERECNYGLARNIIEGVTSELRLVC